MQKRPPHRIISPKDFYNLIIEKIHNPPDIPEGDWLHPEIDIEGYIVNNKVTIEDQLIFKDFEFDKVRIRFINCKLKGRYIFESINLRSIVIIYSEVDVIEIKKSSLEVFDFSYCTGFSVSVTETKFRQFIQLRECTIRNNVKIDKVKPKSLISLNNLSVKNLIVNESNSKFTLGGGKYDYIKLKNNNFTNIKISLTSLTNSDRRVRNPIVIENDNQDYKYGKLELGPNFNSSLIIKGEGKNYFKIDELEFNDSVFSEIDVMIDFVEVSKIKFNRLINSGILSIFNVYFAKNSNFEIDNSFLGKTRLYNCDFGKFMKFKFKLSDITDLTYNNVEWPEDLCKDENNDRIELYKQLKYVANKNGDSINAVKFYAIEKDAFYKKIGWSKEEFGTKLIFLFNKISNNNNLSWLKPIGLNLLMQLFIFVVIGLTLKLNFAITNFSDYMTPFFKFLYLLNPAFKSETIHSKIDNYNFTIVLVTLSRLISAYLIYQTIAAYRRYK